MHVRSYLRLRQHAARLKLPMRCTVLLLMAAGHPCHHSWLRLEVSIHARLLPPLPLWQGALRAPLLAGPAVHLYTVGLKAGPSSCAVRVPRPAGSTPRLPPAAPPLSPQPLQ